MRALIIGADGMLGHCLIRVFGDTDLLAWDRRHLDITDAAAVRERIAAAHPDILINAAAYNAVDRAEQEPELAEAVNGTAARYLAEAAVSVGATFVHYSTDYVFDGTERVGYAEDAAPRPISAYGRSKLLGELAVREVAASHPSWRWYLVRTSRLFGPPGLSLNVKKSFVDAMIELGKTRNQIKVIDEEVSSPTYAPDLAAATRSLVEAGVAAGIYHRANADFCTWYGFAQEIFRAIGWRGTLRPVSGSAFPRSAKRPSYSVLRTTKLPPLRPWPEALWEYLKSLQPL